MDLSAANAAALAATTTPLVLRVMPLPGSPAPNSYIYDPTPTLDGDGGLLAAASTFFIHYSHQVFHDPCPDLAAYPRARGIMATIIEVDRLPDHVLTVSLNLLKTPSLSSKGDALSTSFMVAYILAPMPPVPQGLVSLSPMGNFEGRSLSFWGPAPVMGGLWRHLFAPPHPFISPGGAFPLHLVGWTIISPS
jgi:hypothetical protein